MSGLLSDLYAYPEETTDTPIADLGERLGGMAGEKVAAALATAYVPPGPWISVAEEIAGKVGEIGGGGAGRELFAEADWGLKSLQVAVQELSDWRAWHQALSRAMGVYPGLQ